MTLTNQQVLTVVNRYIGVSGGYLGNFTYRTHADFYAEYCGLEGIDPNLLPGTTRERFISVLTSQGPINQSRILRGVVERFGDNDSEEPSRIRLREEIMRWAYELEGGAVVGISNPNETRQVVLIALENADNLMRTSGPASAIDRIHTALHGHLLSLCDAANIELEADATSTRALKQLRRDHPALKATGPRAQEITRILNSLANVLDTLNPIRNNASVAHPNLELLDDPEARLAINAGRTIFAYLDDKLGGTS